MVTPASTAPPDRKIIKKTTSTLPLLIGTVPEDRYCLTKTTRNKKKNKLLPGKVNLKRKGVEPEGPNNTIWRAQWEMQNMFLRGKLLGGTIPSETANSKPTKSSNVKSKSGPPNLGKVSLKMQLKHTVPV